MKKILCFLPVLALLLCSACAGRGTGKSIAYAIDASPATLDPQYASESGAKIVINNVFEGLVRFGPEGAIVPGIAEKWEISEDGLTYTFFLQKDTEWYCPSSFKTQYGEEFYKKFVDAKVNAEDFIFACRRAVDPAIKSPNAGRLMVIAGAADIYAGKAELSSLGVTAPDEYTLVFTLTEPCPDFLTRLTESEFMPCNADFYNAMSGRYGLTKNTLLCNGPFYLSYWDPESQITIKKNKYYAGKGEVIPLSVAITFDPNAESVSKKLSNGSLSAALLKPLSEIPEGVTVAKEIPDTVIGLAFNCSDPLLSNPDIRKALCCSVDKSLFGKSESFGKANGFIPACCYVGSDSYRSRVGSQTPNIEGSVSRAKKYWQRGLEALEISTAEVNILCPDRFDGVIRDQLQVWQKSLGITLSVSVVNGTDEEIAKAVNSGNYQAAVCALTTGEHNAVNYLAQFEDGGIFRYSDVNFAAVIRNLKASVTDDDIINGCFTAEAMILREGVFFPLMTGSSKFALNSEITGITVLDTEDTVCFINAKRFD